MSGSFYPDRRFVRSFVVGKFDLDTIQCLYKSRSQPRCTSRHQLLEDQKPANATLTVPVPYALNLEARIGPRMMAAIVNHPSAEMDAMRGMLARDDGYVQGA